MGLDMYLYGEVAAPKESNLFKVVEENLSAEHRQQFNDGEGAYISGWTFGDGPDTLYNALCSELGFTAYKGSPHMMLMKQEDGYAIQVAIYYWRKANAIHNWFVQEVQGGVDECQLSEVHPELLADLVDRCRQVAADHTKTNLLTPTAGFFFGSTDIDDWYFEEIETTAEELPKIIEAARPKISKILYRSSW